MSNARVRFGAEIRKRAEGVDRARSSRYQCPKCDKASVKRRGNSLWECRSCGAVFAGGAYALSTVTGESARKMVADRPGK